MWSSMGGIDPGLGIAESNTYNHPEVDRTWGVIYIYIYIYTYMIYKKEDMRVPSNFICSALSCVECAAKREEKQQS